ncbi:MAG: hypothetical protein ACLQF2_14550 [Rhodomicrobium sp.]
MPSATENNGQSSGLDETHLLVPWYVAGTLEDAEARELEKLAKDDPEFAKLISEASREAQATVSVNEAAGHPSRAVWERIGRSIEEEKKARSSVWLAKEIHSLKASISSFLAGITMPQWQAVAAAAVAICVIQAGAIVYLSGSGTAPPKFHAASGPQTVKHSVFIVSFADDASIGDIGKTLDEAGAVIVDGPNADMLYHLGLRNGSAQAKEQAYVKLKASGIVKQILPE